MLPGAWGSLGPHGQASHVRTLREGRRMAGGGGEGQVRLGEFAPGRGGGEKATHPTHPLKSQPEPHEEVPWATEPRGLQAVLTP